MYKSGDTVLHETNPQFGVGIVISVTGHDLADGDVTNTAKVAWPGVTKAFISEHNCLYLVPCK